MNTCKTILRKALAVTFNLKSPLQWCVRVRVCVVFVFQLDCCCRETKNVPSEALEQQADSIRATKLCIVALYLIGNISFSLLMVVFDFSTIDVLLIMFSLQVCACVRIVRVCLCEVDRFIALHLHFTVSDCDHCRFTSLWSSQLSVGIFSRNSWLLCRVFLSASAVRV